MQIKGSVVERGDSYPVIQNVFFLSCHRKTIFYKSDRLVMKVSEIKGPPFPHRFLNSSARWCGAAAFTKTHMDLFFDVSFVCSRHDRRPNFLS